MRSVAACTCFLRFPRYILRFHRALKLCLATSIAAIQRIKHVWISGVVDLFLKFVFQMTNEPSEGEQSRLGQNGVRYGRVKWSKAVSGRVV